ncbi:MAG: NAD(P)/FAD-dependent oxidoreductase [Anaerolineae bacterium]
MRQDTDVIVVGAGPGGSVTAAAMAKQGLRVLMLDRAEFPRDKVCGDAVAGKCLDLLTELGVGNFDSPDYYKIDCFTVIGPSGRSLRYDFSKSAEPRTPSAIVPRLIFDNDLFQFAMRNGVNFCKASVNGLIIENGQVVGVKARSGKQEMEFRASLVIGADGASSVVARDLNARQPREDRWAVALRAYIKTDVPLDRNIDFAFLDKIQPGYAWFFPISEYEANIGVGMRSDFYKKQNYSLEDALAYYMTTPEVKRLIGSHKPENVRSWSLPIYTPDLKRVFNGALLIGDAGAFITPLAGAGINTAIVTGLCAAQAAQRAFRLGDFSERGLRIYNALWRKEIGANMRRELWLHNVLSVVPQLIDSFLAASRSVPALVPTVLGKL